MVKKNNKITNIPLMTIAKDYLEFEENGIIYRQGLVMSCVIPEYSKGTRDYWYMEKDGIYIGMKKMTN